MTAPLVSVIIPVYNAAEHLRACVDSVIAQTWLSVEIIIIDDGSTDGSLSIANSYCSNNIKVISQPNQGASSARNEGLKVANGEYIQFLDADDLLSPDKIEQQVRLLEKNPRNIAVCSTVHFDDGTDHLNSLPSAYEDSFLINADPVYFLINLWGGYSENGSMVQPNAWLCPRQVAEAAGEWNQELTLDDDGEYFTRVLLQSDGIVKSGGKNYYRKYRQRKASLSASYKQESMLSQLRSLQLKYQHISQFNSSLNLKTAYARSLCELKFKLYPNFKSIILIIDKELNALNIDFKFQPQFGTKTGKLISCLLGWRLTKHLRMLIK